MSKQGINKRLLTLASFVEPGKVVADIGTDHAYLPIYLVQSGKVSRVIACDINEKPLRVAEKNVISSGLASKIELRLGNGLQVLRPGEVQLAVIAGMGGGTVRQILEASPKVLASLERLVLQPMGDEADLRRWLLDNGWQLTDETLVLEDERLYTVIVSEKGNERIYDPVILEVGPRLIEKKHPLLPDLLNKLTGKYRQVLQGLSQSTKPEARCKLETVKEYLRRLEEVAEKCR
ncbi:tRNA (adenine22-N1)-methyltransferase [Desulfohalotomaculum tongense]|uniref:tRNA (adenine(22)-N(1))-methyltransferase n=1 Tax=Desulforadius tongensis TaxID=1216062 RepID=UPI001958A307|nr:class I SAM-dependent methyltransferase [Desulforadius tongensis]MBM7855768.1 tRNA (adenine22-N1)-methyltransferase [Desulforadius tongensis]